MSIRSAYIPSSIEADCQAAWKQSDAFLTTADTVGTKNTYVYACTPFTTGKAHMGHVRSYTIADVCARWARSKGESVLWSMGFDSFGLPNEITAIENAIAPRDWVSDCAERMRKQFDALGLSVDWSRCFITSEPDYYRWTQWIFLRLLEKGLIYKARGVENWCERCKSVLATLQVSDEDLCWRCNGPVTLASVEQWYLRFSPYADELERTLSQLEEWDEAIIASQRTLLGRTEGIEFEIEFPDAPPLKVFTPYPADISSGAFIALSPNHPYVDRLVFSAEATTKLDAQRRRAVSREARGDNGIPVIESGLSLRIPGLSRELPVVITNVVDLRFGGGAVLGVPNLDTADALLAAQLKLNAPDEIAGQPTTRFRRATRYRLRDSSISRQRSWGTPVPVIHCHGCGAVPVPDEDLPVLLPANLIPTGEGNALATHPTFSRCLCPRCSSPARRDTDTLDVHVDSIWMLLPFCVPADGRKDQMFTHPELKRWLPVAQVVCGVDQAGWWINDRLVFKFLKDCGYLQDISGREPVKRILMHEMVLSGGRKMSKSLGNAVDPEGIIRRYGADAVRLTVLRVSAHKAFNWTDEALRENFEFLSGVWNFVNDVRAITKYPAPSAPDMRGRSLRRKLQRRCSAAEAKITQAYETRAFHAVLKQLRLLFATLKRFAIQRGDCLEFDDLEEVRIAIKLFLRLLEPLAPHIAFTLSHQIKISEDSQHYQGVQFQRTPEYASTRSHESASLSSDQPA